MVWRVVGNAIFTFGKRERASEEGMNPCDAIFTSALWAKARGAHECTVSNHRSDLAAPALGPPAIGKYGFASRRCGPTACVVFPLRLSASMASSI